MESDKNFLQEPIELLLKDGHSDVVWGEQISGIAELRKRLDTANPLPSSIDGYIIIKFIDAPKKKDIETLLKQGEEVRDGVSGTLNKSGYTPDSLHVDEVDKSGSSRGIINFEKSTASIYIKFDNGKYTVDKRAVEIAEAYHHIIIKAKDWVMRK